MANFDIEFDKVIVAEGIYGNDPDDAGGETCYGITRKSHPKSPMWSIIDSIKKQYGTKNINSRIKSNKEILKYAKDIYKSKYWDCIKLDKIPSQEIAHQFFDTAVNMGITAAIKIIQDSLGVKVTGKFSDELVNKLINYGKDI